MYFSLFTQENGNITIRRKEYKKSLINKRAQINPTNKSTKGNWDRDQILQRS